MSNLTTLARPYAKAAFALARDGDGLERWEGMLALAAQLIGHAEVAALLANPVVSARQAQEVLSTAAGEQFDARFNAFLGVLAHNRRLPLLAEIAALYSRLKQEAEKRLRVKVVLAGPLEADQAGRMRAALARRFEREIELHSEIDERILGGAVIYAGDEVIDGSLRGRIQKLASALGA